MIKALMLLIAVIKSWLEVLLIPMELIVDLASAYFVVRYIMWDYFFNNKDFWELMGQQPNVLMTILIVGFFSSRLTNTIIRNSNKEK